MIHCILFDDVAIYFLNMATGGSWFLTFFYLSGKRVVMDFLETVHYA